MKEETPGFMNAIQIMIPAFPVSLEITRFFKRGAGNHQNLFSIVT